MSQATLIFEGRSWLWFAAGAVALALGLLVWSYRATNRGGFAGLCLGLKLLGFTALAICLLDPLWSRPRVRPGANLFAVMADNSQGLQIKDRGQKQSRGQSLRDLLNPQRGSWQGVLEQEFQLRRYLFDTRLQNTSDFGQLTFDGRATALASALRDVAERYRGRPLAGVLLFTDGNATDLSGELDAAGLPPIYPVVIGKPEGLKDLGVQEAHATQSTFEDAPVSVQAQVSALGYNGQEVSAQLLDAAGKPVAEQSVRVASDKETLAFRFQLRPETNGLCFYRLNVRAKSELNGRHSGAAAEPVRLVAGERTADNSASRESETSAEATLANNHAILAVDRGQGPYRILYVAGRPNWEYKFLNRALDQDDQLQLVGLIRVARREPKFNFLGRPGETSNPLFRGFGDQAPDETERYDQPVLVRLNTRDKAELRTGFPSTAEELYQYAAVIVDDLEAEFFTPDQAALLQKFVSERGGGFLMLGGMECFQQGKYQRTPIGDMLPVYLEGQVPAPSGPLRLQLTREGWLQSWARLRDNERAEEARLQSMAPFLVFNAVREIKPGASVIATVSDAAAHSWPALVVQRFGRGRTAALTIGDVWHWGLHDAEAHRDMDKTWRQLMRWLVTDVPNRVDLTVQPNANGAGAVELQVRVRDPKFQALDNATVTLEIQPALTEPLEKAASTLRLRAEPSLSEPGLYQATYVPRLTGGYKATATVTNSEGAAVGRALAGWTMDLAADEFRSLTPNVDLLKSIAQKTGGEIVAANQLDQFVRGLPHRHAPIMESSTFPLWHTPAMFGLALFCFLAEWGLRRWKGMP